MTLFDVAKVSGVYARMNDVYSKLGEVHNTLKTLRAVLNLGEFYFPDMFSIVKINSAHWPNSKCSSPEPPGILKITFERQFISILLKSLTCNICIDTLIYIERDGDKHKANLTA